MAKVERITISSITKEGALLIINTNEYDNPFKFNLTDRSFFSYTGKSVRNLTPSFRHINNHAYYRERENKDYFEQLLICDIHEVICSAVKGYNDRGTISQLKTIDLFFAHRDLIKDRLYNLPTECPKGYIPWLRKNNKLIDNDTLTEYKVIQSQKNIPTQVKQFFDFLDKHPIGNKYQGYTTIENIKKYLLIRCTREQAVMVTKIFNTSIKNFNWNLSQDLVEFYNFVCCNGSLYYNHEYICNCVKDWEKYVSPDVDFARNLETMLQLNYSRKNEILTEQQTILANEFNNYEIGDYVIIVPTTYEQLVDEGNQQHNCVGRCYHDNIRNGIDWIYFIRHKDTPNESFITCQYNRQSRNTIQYKYKFNRCIYSNDEMYTMIRNITKEISDKFKK